MPHRNMCLVLYHQAAGLSQQTEHHNEICLLRRASWARGRAFTKEELDNWLRISRIWKGRSIREPCSCKGLRWVNNNTNFSDFVVTLGESFFFSTGTGTSKWANVHVLLDLANRRLVGFGTRAVRQYEDVEAFPNTMHIVPTSTANDR